MDKKQTETVLRIAVTGIQYAQGRVRALHKFKGESNDHLAIALGHMDDAIHALQNWAANGDYTISEGMPT